MLMADFEVKNLSLAWDNGQKVVEHASLEVSYGETIALVGRSGTGKTTILHGLAGLIKPLEGQVFLEGEDISGQAGKISYMFQKDLLIPSKKIIDNVVLPLRLKGRSKEQAYQQARDLFEIFGLAGTEQLWPHELSGGMRQRAACMRTYLMGNRTILLDEPFSALDAFNKDDLHTWYKDVSKKFALASILVTHDVAEAVALASRIYVLKGNPAKGEVSRIAAELIAPTASELKAALS